MAEEKTSFGALLETLAKIFGVALVLVTALGLPAIAIQMWRLSIPVPIAGALTDVLVSSLERGMAVRAGVVPALALALLSWGMGKLEAYNKTYEERSAKFGQPRPPSELTTVTGAVAFSSLAAAFVLTVTLGHFLGGLISTYFWRSQINRLTRIETIGEFFIPGVILLLHFITRGSSTWWLLAPVRKITQIGNRWEKERHTGSVMTFSLLVSLVVFACPSLVVWIDHHFWRREPPILSPTWTYIFYAGVGSLVGMLPVFLAGVMQRVHEQATRPWYRRTLWTTAVVYLYLPFALAWSVKFYPVIPYAWGGGKPTACTVWVDHKKFPEDDLRARLLGIKQYNEHDSTRLENSFLVYIGSDAVILADSDDPFAQAIFLPRDSIQAIAHKR